ncbi:hypothetical protein MKX01_019881 [Papaver californicum]|nr:hypothetical protein MKX01_019881 [Papaver californicum]
MSLKKRNTHTLSLHVNGNPASFLYDNTVQVLCLRKLQTEIEIIFCGNQSNTLRRTKAKNSDCVNPWSLLPHFNFIGVIASLFDMPFWSVGPTNFSRWSLMILICWFDHGLGSFRTWPVINCICLTKWTMGFCIFLIGLRVLGGYRIC